MRRNIILALGAAALAIPTAARAQGGVERLSKVELLALQQEMRDRGCGNQRAPGVITAETRRAVRKCMRDHNVTTARGLLAAFDIGYGSGGSGGSGGMGVSGSSGADFGTYESDTAPGSVRRRMEAPGPKTPERIKGTPSRKVTGDTTGKQ